jgi:integrase
MPVWKKDGLWYVRVQRQGQIYRGDHGYPKKEEALAEQARIKLSLKSSKTQGTSRGMFLEIWIQYLKHCEAYNGKAWFDAKRYIGAKQFSKWFARDIADIGPAEIEAHLVERRKLSARSANLDFEILRNFFRWSVEMCFLGESPMRPLRKFSQNRPVKIIPTKEEIDKLIGTNIGLDRLLILLLVFTMGRISEIKGLQWKDIDLEHKVLHLRTRKTRDGSESSRAIPINGLLMQCLTEQPKDGPYVLHSVDGKPYMDLRKRLKRCVRSAGITSINGFHQFRHYGASTLANAGVDLKTIQELLGYTTLDTTNIYLQSLSESKRRAMEVL